MRIRFLFFLLLILLGATQAQIPILYKFKTKNAPVLSLAFNRNDTILASGGEDGIITLWDMGSGKKYRELRGHLNQVNTLAFSSEHDILVSGSNDRTIRIWYLTDTLKSYILTGTISSVTAVDIYDNRIASASLDSMIMFWDLNSKIRTKTFNGQNQWVHTIAFNPSGDLLAIGGTEKKVIVLKKGSSVPLYSLRGHDYDVRSVAFNSDSLLASAGDDKVIYLWNIKNGIKKGTLTGHTDIIHSLSFHPSGQILASAGDDMTLKLWDMVTGKEIISILQHEDFVTNVKFSNNGKLLASSGRDNTLLVWNMDEFLFSMKLSLTNIQKLSYPVFLKYHKDIKKELKKLEEKNRHTHSSDSLSALKSDSVAINSIIKKYRDNYTLIK